LIVSKVAGKSALSRCSGWESVGRIWRSVPAQFDVVSTSEIKAGVPPGVMTGKIEVITPAATLFTRLALFRVTSGVSNSIPPR